MIEEQVMSDSSIDTQADDVDWSQGPQWVDKNKQKSHETNLRQAEKKIQQRSVQYPPDQKLAKPILDKWAVKIARLVQTKEITDKKTGNKKTIIDDDPTKYEVYYDSDFYGTDICLWIPPQTAVRIEFEDTKENNKKHIAGTEAKLKAFGIDYCVTGHDGKSDYINIFNIQNMPMGDDYLEAKKQFVAEIVPRKSYKYLDKSNLGMTFSPVIGHPHWKKKYDGKVHRLIRGKNPLKHRASKNKIPKEVLQRAKRKRIQQEKREKEFIEVAENPNWVNDFLLGYCLTADDLGSNRHNVIEKNLALLIYGREDRDAIIQKYNKNKGAPANVATWFSAIERGDISQVSPLELAKYIRQNELPYKIPLIDLTANKKKLPLQKDEREKAIHCLQHPNLLENIVKGVHIQEGLVGEDENIRAIVNKILIGKVENAKATSSNLLVSDVSGGGKDALLGAVTNFVVQEESLIHRTRISDHALEYWHEKDIDFTWDGKVLYLEDPPKGLLTNDVFRTMLSGGNNVTVVREQEAVDLHIPGKPVVLVSSFQTTLDHESIRRVDQTRVDTSEEQTDRIIAKKLQNAVEAPEKKILFLSRALEALEPQKVVIPYFHYIHMHIKGKTIMRTKVDTLADFIKASAILHQYQRDRNEKGSIIATAFDYEYGRRVFQHLHVGGLPPMSVDEEEIYRIIERSDEGELTISQIAERHPRRETSWIYDNHKRLIEKGILSMKKMTEVDGRGRRPTFLYISPNIKKFDLPAFENLGIPKNFINKYDTKQTSVSIGNAEEIPFFRTSAEKLEREENGNFSIFPRHLGVNEKNEKQKIKNCDFPDPAEKIKKRHPSQREGQKNLSRSAEKCGKNTPKKGHLQGVEAGRGKMRKNAEKINQQKIDPSNYILMLNIIEEKLGSSPINFITLGKRMGKTNLDELGKMQDIIRAAVNNPSFKTRIRINEKGFYYKINTKQ